jgi:hypothetical protein
MNVPRVERTPRGEIIPTATFVGWFREVWNEGTKLGPIMDMLRQGVTKNQLVGIKNRHPGFILHQAARKQEAVKVADRAGATTLPPLLSGSTELFVTTTRIVPRINNPMGRAPTTTPHDERQIKLLRATGAGYGTISRRTGWSEDIVRRVCGWTRPSRPGRPSQMPAQEPPQKPVIQATPRVEAPTPVPIATPGQCERLLGSRPYRQCDSPVATGPDVSRPWVYCAACRADCYVKIRGHAA